MSARSRATAAPAAVPAPIPAPAPEVTAVQAVPAMTAADPGAAPVTGVDARPTLTEFLIDEQRKVPGATGAFTALVNDLRLACKRIATIIGKGGLLATAGRTGTVNVQGEDQAPLDLLADDILSRTLLRGGTLAGMLSEEHEAVRPVPPGATRGRYLLAFDPLDGSSNIDVNVSVGTIFSVVVDPDPDAEVGPGAFLQPGSRQVCAGYAIYGPVTMLVLTLGRGVHGFTLDREIGEFILTHPDLRIPARTNEFAINVSNARHWEPAVARYVDECMAGANGPRGRDFNMRWVASLVAEAHRILLRGGVFLYPRDERAAGRRGKLRLLYEANPIGMLIEQAGGRASTGEGPVLDVVPGDVHQRTGFVFGSREEVERIEAYHRDHNARRFDAPLFGSRGLFRTGGR